MFRVLFLLFIVMPILEIVLLFKVSSQIGGWTTIGIIILTAVIGSYLVKQQGIQTFSSAQGKLQTGQVPSNELLEGLFIIVAGVLLLTPGFVTDGFGLLCLFPVTRKIFVQQILKHGSVINMNSHFNAQAGHQYSQSTNHDTNEVKGNTYEGEVTPPMTGEIEDSSTNNKD